MDFFSKEHDCFFPMHDFGGQRFDVLPADTYSVEFSLRGFYLKQINKFELPKKIYGETINYTTRVLSTFEDRPAGTGVILSGVKGSGKTLLGKSLSIEGHKRGYPTIVINKPYSGDAFNQFIQSINQPAIVFFDEFEKTYDLEEQKALLTLLDGTYNSKKLFVLTCNNRNLDPNMENRPGRLYYVIEFGGVSDAFIIEFCADVLKNKTHTPNVVAFSKLFYQFNFDMLKSLVEEMNRFDENPAEAARILNAKPEVRSRSTYECELYINDKQIELEENHSKWSGNILSQPVVVYFKSGRKNTFAELQPGHIVKIESGQIVYEDPKKKTSVILTEKKSEVKNWEYLYS